MMRSNVESTCEQHQDRFDCPDALIHFSPEPEMYGLIVHDGGSSMIMISFCPWCAATLPNGVTSDGNRIQ
jgi:hypothetical protein